ncbi:MAG TPA: DMT family transporter [Devosiaceae bacterium]|jgi:drug/metabolite transporter (DMT)-like permease
MTTRITDNKLLIGIACGVGAGAVWGCVFLAPKLLTQFSPFEMSVGRYLIYGLVSLLLVGPRWRKLSAQLTRPDWVALVRLSLLGNIIYYVFVTAAVQFGGIAIASLIVGLLPVVVTLMGARDTGALPLRQLALPLMVIGIGIALINYDLFTHSELGGPPLLKLAGVLCAVVALFCWAFYAVGNSRWLERVHHVSSQDWSLLTGIVTGALAIVVAIPAFWLGAPHDGSDWLHFWSINAGLAIGASVIGNALWNVASRVLPLTLSGQMILFETLFALLYGFVWEQRLPRPLEFAAIAALVIGVSWSARLHQAHAEPKP